MFTDEKLPFLVGGTFAFQRYTGISRPTKDLDVFCKPSDAPKILGFFKDRGYGIEMEDERWIGKVWRGEHFFDVIFNISSASIPITDEWFRDSYEAEVYGTSVRITPPTQFILSKLFLQTRYRYDGADIVHVIRVLRLGGYRLKLWFSDGTAGDRAEPSLTAQTSLSSVPLCARLRSTEASRVARSRSRVPPDASSSCSTLRRPGGRYGRRVPPYPIVCRAAAAGRDPVGLARLPSRHGWGSLAPVRRRRGALHRR